MRFFDKLRSHLLLEFSIGLLISQAMYCETLNAFPLDENALVARVAKENIPLEMKYTVNFNSVSVIEFIRFVSRISGVNFVFQDIDLPFTVTIVSEEPISVRNILSALIQVLRIHNLQLVEQDNNLLITVSGDVRTVAPVVSSDLPGSEGITAPIITRVFRIRNANPNTLASIIRPMTSKSAIVDVANETKQLIVSDVSTNIDKISELITSLDTPHTALDIETYIAKTISPEQLIALTEKIITPFAEDNPIIFVPQTETGTIFIVSTPNLIDKALTILEDLDVATRSESEIAPSTENQFLLYNPVNRDGKELEKSLKEISKNLRAAGLADISFLHSIDTMRWVPDNNALLFTGNEAALDKIKGMLNSIDIASLAEETVAESKIPKSSFYIYRPLHLAAEAMVEDVKDLAQDMTRSGLVDPDLVYALETCRLVESSNSILFTGTGQAIEKVKEVLKDIDVPGAVPVPEIIEGKAPATFIIYSPKNVPVDQLMEVLRSVASGLTRSETLNQGIITSIHGMKLIKESDSLLFTGAPEVLAKIQDLLQQFDRTNVYEIEEGKQIPAIYVLYSPKYQTGPELMESLKDFEHNLRTSGIQDKALFLAINNMKWIDRTSALLISGDAQAVQKVQDLLARFDTPSGDTSAQPAGTGIESIENTNFMIYKLQYHKGQEIQVALKDIAKSLAASGGSNQDLVNAISSLQWIKITNSLIASGPQDILTRLRELITNLDVPLRQVFIEVLVIQTNLTNSENIGLQWAGQVQYLNKLAGTTSNLPVTTGGTAIPPPASIGWPNMQSVSGTRFPQAAGPGSSVTSGPDIPFQQGFDLGVIGDLIFHKGKSFVSLASFVNALEQDSNSSVLLNPKIITQDNNNSTIFVGQNIPFPASAVQTNAAISQQTTSNLEYRDVGVNLSITPVIGVDNVVTMDVTVDISTQVANTVTSTTLLVQGVQTAHTNMTTRVHVPDKTFVALSGLINDTKIRFKTGLPCLGGLPVIGLAFSQNARQDQTANVIIFLRPHIINSIDTYRQITENQEHLFKDEAKYPILKEEFDSGLDFVKMPEDEP